MDPRIADFIRYTLLTLALLVAALFAHKHYKRYTTKKEIVAELQELTSDSSFYRQFESEDAKSTLLRCIALMHRANQLGLNTNELFDRVHRRAEIDDYVDITSKEDLPIQEQIVRNTLTSAYDAAKRLDMLGTSSFRELQDGRLPITLAGTPVILPLIDPEISPGLDKIIPNLEILPPDRTNENRELTTVERAAARNLARNLASARIIENTVADQIIDHYETPKQEPTSGKEQIAE